MTDIPVGLVWWGAVAIGLAVIAWAVIAAVRAAVALYREARSVAEYGSQLSLARDRADGAHSAQSRRFVAAPLRNFWEVLDEREQRRDERAEKKARSRASRIETARLLTTSNPVPFTAGSQRPPKE